MIQTMEATQATMGDRILYLIRTKGREERGREYEQQDLVAMLTGKQKAPNGRYYNFETSNTAVCRLIGGGLTQYRMEILEAICEMFGTNMEWLVRGNVLQPSQAIEAFVSDEANRAGTMIDAMDEDLRATALDIIRKLYSCDQERRNLHGEIYELLSTVTRDLEGDNKIRANSIFRKIRG